MPKTHMSTHSAPSRRVAVSPAVRRELAAAAAELGAALDDLIRIAAEPPPEPGGIDPVFEAADDRRLAASKALFELMDDRGVSAVIAGGKLYTSWGASIAVPDVTTELLDGGECVDAARLVDLDAKGGAR